MRGSTGSVDAAVDDDAARRHWDRVAEAWPAGPPPLWRRQSDAVNEMLLDRWLPAGDVGSVLKTDLFDELAGVGLYPALRSRAKRVVAVDLSPAVVVAARARYPELEAEVANAMDLPFGDGSFDAIVSNSTLDHLASRADLAAAVAELARVTRPGGRLLLTLDNPLNPLIALRNALPRRVARAVRGVPFDAGVTCRPRELRSLLDRSGFSVRELTAILHFPRGLVAGVDRIARQSRATERWMAALRAAERLERWPTRYLTGHFVAALGVRASADGA